MYVVYGLQDPRDNAVFYVGMTTDVYRRFISHLKCEDNNEAKNKRIDELRALGLVPRLITFEVVHTEQIARKRETYWIQHYIHLGVRLTNISQKIKVQKQIKSAAQSVTRQQTYKPSGLISKENEQLVREVLIQYPNAGPREIERRTGLPVASVWRCLKRIREVEKPA